LRYGLIEPYRQICLLSGQSRLLVASYLLLKSPGEKGLLGRQPTYLVDVHFTSLAVAQTISPERLLSRCDLDRSMLVSLRGS